MPVQAKNLCDLALWTEVAAALEGLSWGIMGCILSFYEKENVLVAERLSR